MRVKQFAREIRSGPLRCALKLKSTSVGPQPVLAFYLTVGAARRGPFVHDFAGRALQDGGDFEMDWLEQVYEGALTVGVELVDPREPGPEDPGEASNVATEEEAEHEEAGALAE